MARVAIIGAGAMGLAAAYHALNRGHSVTVFEADKSAGGMAAHFDFEGLSIERFYHFICKADESTFELMKELGISNRLVWRRTTMGFYFDGDHYRWGDPVAVLKFPKLDMLSKVRYEAQIVTSLYRNNWSGLDKISAKDWIVGWCGEETYGVLWKRLLELKFFEFADNISAAWLWTRVKRVGRSRDGRMREVLGYIDGGSQVLVDKLVQVIERKGGALRLGRAVEEVTSVNGRVTGVRTGGEHMPFDAVLSTVPTPIVPRMVPGLSDSAKARYAAIRNIGVVCVLLKLAKPVTRHFWLNINDPGIEIPGIIEFSNLRRLPDTVVYVPYYMPQTHPKFDWPDRAFVSEAMSYIQRLNPALTETDLLASHVGRLRHAQPVCDAGFLAKIPKVMTAIEGLQIADTCFYYPEDRGIAESVRYGRLMAQAITDQGVWEAEGR